MRSALRKLALLLLVVAFLGCGGAFAAAIKKGDDFAAAGMWDEAAAAYEEAMKIDPDDPEGSIKLRQARQEQAAERLARAEALEKRGELVTALELVQEAVTFDPASTAVQQAFTRISKAALDRAEMLLERGKPRKAFELTTLVLKGSPHDSRARRIDDQVRNVLAENAHRRAQAFLEQDRLGNALVELAACLHYRPDYPDAKLHFGRVKLDLQEQLRFFVVLHPFKAQGRNAQLRRTLKPELLAQSIDERLLVRVVTKPPPEQGSRGVNVSGQLVDYDYSHQQHREERNCDYVCGTESKPNPRRPQLEQQLGSKEQTVSQADEEIARVEKDVLRYEKEIDKINQEVTRKQSDADRRRQDLDRCQSQAKPGDSSACSSEKSSMRSAQSSLDSARNRLSSPQNYLSTARSRLGSARDRRESARRDADSTRNELRQTPEMITVDKYCPFNYSVTVHDVAAQVVMRLTLDRLAGGKAIITDQPFNYETKDQDKTFPAHPGRCSAVASGDPLRLPSEEDLRKTLLNKVIKDLRTKVMASYDSYRASFLTDARRHEAGGLSEEAVEAYVRYLLTGPHNLKGKDKIKAFFAKTKGFSQLDALFEL